MLDFTYTIYVFRETVGECLSYIFLYLCIEFLLCAFTDTLVQLNSLHCLKEMFMTYHNFILSTSVPHCTFLNNSFPFLVLLLRQVHKS